MALILNKLIIFTKIPDQCVEIQLYPLHTPGVEDDGGPFLDQNIRFHCPIYCYLTWSNLLSFSFKGHVWKFEQGD